MHRRRAFGAQQEDAKFSLQLRASASRPQVLLISSPPVPNNSRRTLKNTLRCSAQSKHEQRITCAHGNILLAVDRVRHGTILDWAP